MRILYSDAKDVDAKDVDKAVKDLKDVIDSLAGKDVCVEIDESMTPDQKLAAVKKGFIEEGYSKQESEIKAKEMLEAFELMDAPEDIEQ